MPLLERRGRRENEYSSHRFRRREHASRCLVKSPRLRRLFLAPGNPAWPRWAKIVDLDCGRSSRRGAFCRANGVGLVVIGPEPAFDRRLVDDLAAQDILAFGPTRAAAATGGIKGSPRIYARYNSDRRLRPFDKEAAALAYLRDRARPIVVKADGWRQGGRCRGADARRG